MEYKNGDIIEVTISAIQPYGAFAIVDDTYTGLIHISEISSKFVKIKLYSPISEYSDVIFFKSLYLSSVFVRSKIDEW